MTIITEAFNEASGFFGPLMLFGIIFLIVGIITALVNTYDMAWEWIGLGVCMTVAGLIAIIASVNLMTDTRESRQSDLMIQLTDAGFENINVDYGDKSFTGSKNGDYILCGFLAQSENTYQLACNPSI